MAQENVLMAACDLGILGAAIGTGWEYRDLGKAPGERSLAALVSSATLDPARSIREYRAEARIAARGCSALDAFSTRRLLARSRRYQLAAALVEERCAACAAPCAAAPYALRPGMRERRIPPARRAGSRVGGRRLDDHVGSRAAVPA